MTNVGSMSLFRIAGVRRTPEPNAVPFPAYLRHPFAMLYAGFMTIMVAISFDIPAVSAIAYQLRWPVMGLFAAAGLFRAMLIPGFRLSAPYKLLAGLLTLAVISAAVSVMPSYTFMRSVSLWMLFFATAVGLCHYCMRRDNLVAFTDAVWCIGAFLVATGFVFRAGGLESPQRYVGIQNTATGAGAYAALFLPIALYQVRYRFRGMLRLLGWMVVGMMIVQPILASARTALVISFVVGSALCIDYYGRRALVATAMLACLMPLALLIDTKTLFQLHDKAERVVRASSIRTFTGRLDRWTFGIEQWWRKPVFGHGFGTSRYLAGMEEPHRFRIQPGDVFNLHSDQIEILIDLGIVGWTCFNLMWLALAAAGLKLVMSGRSPQRQLALAYLGATFYTFVDTFMHGGFLAAGGGTSTYTWSFIAAFTAISMGQSRFRGAGFKARSLRRRQALRNRIHHGPRRAGQPTLSASKPNGRLPSARALIAAARERS